MLYSNVKLLALIATACICAMFTIGVSLGFTIYYVQHTEQVQCQALEDIIRIPSFKNQPFKQALSTWAGEYKCPPDSASQK